jgi:hypothetical protein
MIKLGKVVNLTVLCKLCYLNMSPFVTVIIRSCGYSKLRLRMRGFDSVLVLVLVLVTLISELVTVFYR